MAFRTRGPKAPQDLRRLPESRLAGAKTVRSERLMRSGAPDGEARAGLCPPTARGGQPRPRPARVASTMSMAARNGGVYIQMRGIEQVRVRRLLRAGRRRGACRARRGAGCRPDIGLVGRARPAARYSAARRRARTSGVAVTKIFASASGQITVPMSRPSSTAPGGCAAKSRWKSSSAARTSGMAETTEAASPIAWRLQRGLIEARRIERLGGGDRRRRVVGLLAGIEHRLGDRAIDQPGVEMAQAVMRGEPLAERALARAAGPSMAMIMTRSAPKRRASARRSRGSWWR